MQLFVIFYGLPSAGIVLDPLPAALIGFTLNVGAYNRGDPRGHRIDHQGPVGSRVLIEHDARAGLRRTILPQAARVAVPPLSNSFISLVKDTRWPRC